VLLGSPLDQQLESLLLIAGDFFKSCIDCSTAPTHGGSTGSSLRPETFPESEDEDNIAQTTQTRYSTINAHHDPPTTHEKNKLIGVVVDVELKR
jgi:hypothetical protein